jgi:hypothetical protein
MKKWNTQQLSKMEEIDNMLNQWIHNTHIRARLRELIAKAIANNAN